MLEPGRVVDRYEVEEELGAGGVATVYRVRHTALGSLHALKVLQLGGRNIRERLIEEGKAQARLKHANIVRVNDVIDVDGNPGLIMEYINGPALDVWLRYNRPSFDVAEQLFRGILAGVTRAHRFGLVHRDLKPGNVLLEPSEDGFVPKVADFGLAKALSDEEGGGSGRAATRSGVAMGTPAYMAPEQVRDSKNVDQRADIFALGCILYELYVGASPFDGPDVLTIFSKLAAGTYRAPEEANPDIPVRIRDTIVGCLSNDREQRIPDCATLRTVLDGGTYTPPPTLSPPGVAVGELLAQAVGARSARTLEDRPTSETFALAGDGSAAGVAMTGGGRGATPAAPGPARRSAETVALSQLDPHASIAPRARTHTSLDAPGRDLTDAPTARSGLGWAAIAGALGFGGIALVGVGLALGWYFLRGPGAGEDVRPAPSRPVATLSGPTGPGAGEAGATEPGAGEAGATEPGAGEAGATEPGTAAGTGEPGSGAAPAGEASPSAAAAAFPSAAPAAPAAPLPTGSATPPAPSPGTAPAKPPPARTPATATTDTGTVVVSGTVDKVVLSAAGGKHAPGAVPAGTYAVLATFAGTTVTTGSVTVAAGQTVTLTCNAEFQLCKAR